MYFLRGSLPWQGLKAATNKQKYERIGEKKQTTPVKELCDGFPEEFGIYLQYVRKLGFEESPDYDFLRELFNKVLRRMGESDDGVYDWMLNGKIETRESRRQAREEQSKSRRSNTPNSVKRHASHPKISQNTNTNIPPLPITNTTTMPTTPSAAITTTNANDAYTKMPEPTHEISNNYDQETNKHEHRGFWHSFMSLMTCGTH
jgi:casein kinase 1